MVRVWIVFSPYLLSDTLSQLIAALDGVEVVSHPFNAVDVIVFPLDEFGEPDLGLLPLRAPPAKLLAVSRLADQALVRLPGSHAWEEIRPFSISELLTEVRAGQQRAASPVAQASAERARWRDTLARWRAGFARGLAPLRRPRAVRLQPAFLAALIVAYYLSLSTIASAEAALPGQPLYGLKRWTEKAQLALAPDAADVGLNAHFAERRLHEIEVLAARGVVLPALIDDMAQSTEAALTGALPDQQPQVMTQLVALTQRQRLVLSNVGVPARDPATEAALTRALQVSAVGHQQVAAVLGTQAESPTPAGPAATPRPVSQPTNTRMPLVDPTATQRAAPSATATVPTSTPTNTLVPSTPTASRTPVPSKTPTVPPTDTALPTATPEPTSTWTPSATASPTDEPTSTPTATPSPEPTDTPPPTATATSTPTETEVPTATPTLEEALGDGASHVITSTPVIVGD